MNQLKINGFNIVIEQNEHGEYHIGIKEFCIILQIGYQNHLQHIYDNDILQNVWYKKDKDNTGIDSNNLMLPIKYFLSWLLVIEKNDDIEDFIEYKNKCYSIVYDHFYLDPKYKGIKKKLIETQQAVVYKLKAEIATQKQLLNVEKKKLFNIEHLDEPQLIKQQLI